MQDNLQWQKRQQVLADFGEFALRNEQLDDILSEACRLVGEALETKRAKVLEIETQTSTLFVRAGVGRDNGIVGHLRLPMAEFSSETYSIEAGEPVIIEDAQSETRFQVPAFMKAAGVVALANVPIFLPGGKAYGLLQVDSQLPRRFDREDIEFLRTYAAILGPVIDRLNKVRELRDAEERFRLIVEAARDYAIFTTDANDRIVDWLPGAAAVFGWTADQAKGQHASILFTPEDLARGEDVKEIETARREGIAPNVRWHRHKDGSRVFIEGSVTCVRDGGGQAHGFLKIGQNVTERRRTEERIRDSEARQRALIEGIPQLVWQAANDGRWTWSSSQWSAFTGLTPEESLGFGWHRALHPEDHPALMRAWSEANDSGSFEEECLIRRQDGTDWRWFAMRARPVRNDSGAVVEWLGTATDVDEIRRMQQRQEIMVTELQHRTRNLIAVVQSIAGQTMAGSGTIDDFRLLFNDRLTALARVQGLLSRAAQEPITLAALVRVALDALGATDRDRVRMGGPEVALRNSSIQTLALALHELATNARKYGALSVPDGRLDVVWRIHEDGTNRRVELVWEEHGRNPQLAEAAIAAPGGYGRKLIERALPHSLSAKTTFDLSEAGVRCTISLPLDHVERERTR